MKQDRSAFFISSGGVRFKVIAGVTIYDDCNKEEKKQVIDWELLSNFMTAMLAIVNPVEKIPLWWVAVTDSEKKSFEWLLGTLVISSCALILFIFLWIGSETLLALHVR